ncbi:MAG: hypothetical protein HY596_00050 [Candidatus Omnitrophica bacterium]|nr:hypothetical protein [Candidatus Omnitrophota bacterium]
MRRGVLIGLIAAVVLCIVLAVAVASIGTQLDETRLDRDDLEMQVDDLQGELDSLRTERDTVKTERETLKTRTEEQLKTIEQLKAESGRTANSQTQLSGQQQPAPASTP